MAQVARIPVSLQKSFFPHPSLLRKAPSATSPHLTSPHAHPHPQGQVPLYALFHQARGTHLPGLMPDNKEVATGLGTD